MESQATKFTPRQLELLRIFARNPSEQELLDLGNLIARYYAGKATDEMDKLWEERGYTAETMKEWTHAHLRTPYIPEHK
ncbi:MAG: hypothetical protein IAF08_06115 [Rhizobacter sp.]|nr:hypothetical protein [Chlorobiales bacterium]